MAPRWKELAIRMVPMVTNVQRERIIFEEPLRGTCFIFFFLK